MTDTDSRAIAVLDKDLLPGKVLRVNDYADLKHLIKKNGLLEKQPLYYTYKILLTLGMLTCSIVLLCFVHIFWIQLLNATFLGLVSAQFGFLGHDAGHRQIFHSTQRNNLVALLMGNLLVGMSKDWWVDKHNRHHSHPNQEGLDPDIEIAVIALTKEEALRKRSYQRFIVKYQAFFFFPLLALVGMDLELASITHLLRKKSKERVGEGVLLTLHYLLYLSVIFYNLNIWQALLFILIHQLIFGFLLGSAFAPNHKGMPILDKDDPIDFLRRQVLTSRNINGSALNDFWYGGLNYQIEHHLFPSMPRNNLKKAQRIIKAFCQANSIAYAETGVMQSYREILSFLHSISAALHARQI